MWHAGFAGTAAGNLAGISLGEDGREGEEKDEGGEHEG